MKDYFLGKTVYLRLVTLEDAAELVRLRTAPRCAGRLHPVSTEVEHQRQWLRDYLERAAHSLERYYVSCNLQDDHVCGAMRILDADGTSFRMGSWVSEAGASPSVALQHVLLIYDEMLIAQNYQEVRLEVQQGNLGSIRFHPKLGAVIVSENEKEISYRLSRAAYLAARPRYQRWLGMGDPSPVCTEKSP